MACFKYREDLNGELQFEHQMVPYSGHGLEQTKSLLFKPSVMQPRDLKSKPIVGFSSHGLNKEQKVCYSGHRLSY